MASGADNQTHAQAALVAAAREDREALAAALETLRGGAATPAVHVVALADALDALSRRLARVEERVDAGVHTPAPVSAPTPQKPQQPQDTDTGWEDFATPDTPSTIVFATDVRAAPSGTPVGGRGGSIGTRPAAASRGACNVCLEVELIEGAFLVADTHSEGADFMSPFCRLAIVVAGARGSGGDPFGAEEDRGGDGDDGGGGGNDGGDDAPTRACTRVARNTPFPQWNEHFRLAAPGAGAAGKGAGAAENVSLVLACFDRLHVGKPRRIGGATIALTGILRSRAETRRWVKLDGPGSRSTLHVALTPCDAGSSTLESHHAEPRTRAIVAATLPKLVEKLALRSTPPALVDTSLSALPFLAQPKHILRALLARVAARRARECPSSRPPQAHARALAEARARAAGVLERWVTDHPGDWGRGGTLAQTLARFVAAQESRRARAHTAPVRADADAVLAALVGVRAAVGTLASADAEETGDDEEEKAGVRGGAVDAAVGGEIGLGLVGSTDPGALAAELTAVEHALLSAIGRSDFVGLAWTRADAEVRAPNVLRYIAWFNRTSHWFASQVLLGDTPEARAVLLAKAIAVADACRALGNYNGAVEVLSALHGVAVSRLKRTWALLPTSVMDRLDVVGQLVSHEDNWRLYRGALANAKHAVPYLGLFLTDFSFIEDGNPTYKNVTGKEEGGGDDDRRAAARGGKARAKGEDDVSTEEEEEEEEEEEKDGGESENDEDATRLLNVEKMQLFADRLFLLRRLLAKTPPAPPSVADPLAAARTLLRERVLGENDLFRVSRMREQPLPETERLRDRFDSKEFARLAKGFMLRRAPTEAVELSVRDLAVLFAVGKQQKLAPGDVALARRSRHTVLHVVAGTLDGAVCEGGRVVDSAGAGELVGALGTLGGHLGASPLRYGTSSGCKVVAAKVSFVRRILEHEPDLAARFYFVLARAMADMVVAAGKRDDTTPSSGAESPDASSSSATPAAPETPTPTPTPPPPQHQSTSRRPILRVSASDRSSMSLTGAAHGGDNAPATSESRLRASAGVLATAGANGTPASGAAATAAAQRRTRSSASGMELAPLAGGVARSSSRVSNRSAAADAAAVDRQVAALFDLPATDVVFITSRVHRQRRLNTCGTLFVTRTAVCFAGQLLGLKIREKMLVSNVEKASTQGNILSLHTHAKRKAVRYQFHSKTELAAAVDLLAQIIEGGRAAVIERSETMASALSLADVDGAAPADGADAGPGAEGAGGGGVAGGSLGGGGGGGGAGGDAASPQTLLSDDDWRLLLRGARSLRLAPGDVVFRQGEEYQCLYHIDAGVCRVELAEPAGGGGSARVLSRMGQGQIFGEITFLRGGGASASVVVDGEPGGSSEGASLVAIDGSFVSTLFSIHPGFAGRFYRYLAGVLAQRVQRLVRENEAVRKVVAAPAAADAGVRVAAGAVREGRETEER